MVGLVSALNDKVSAGTSRPRCPALMASLCAALRLDCGPRYRVLVVCSLCAAGHRDVRGEAHHARETRALHEPVPSPRHNCHDRSSGLTEIYLRFARAHTHTHDAEQVPHHAAGVRSLQLEPESASARWSAIVQGQAAQARQAAEDAPGNAGGCVGACVVRSAFLSLSLSLSCASMLAPGMAFMMCSGSHDHVHTSVCQGP
jgi:hypothetical protein